MTAVNKKKIYALHEFVRKGRIENVIDLIHLGTNVNLKDDVLEYTPLMHALHQFDIAKILIDAGADIEIRDISQQTILHKVTQNTTNSVFIKYLIDKGALLDATDSEGNMAMHYSAAYGNTDVLKLLINDNGIDRANNAGKTMLHLAVEFNSIDNTKYLLNHNADVNLPDNKGCLPLHYACGMSLSQKNNGEFDVYFSNEEIIKEKELHFSITKILIENGSNKTFKDISGNLPIDYARESGNDLILEYL